MIKDDFEENEVKNEMELSIRDTETLVEESKQLLNNLYNIEEHRIKKIITQDDLRNDVSSFVSSQLQNLENQNTLKGLIEAELAKKILAHDLTNDELFRAYSMISGEKSKNIDSLFKLFAPTQSTPNTILTPATNNEEKETVELTSSQRQSIEKLLRIIEHSPNLNTVQNKDDVVE